MKKRRISNQISHIVNFDNFGYNEAMGERRSYSVELKINGRTITEVVIDSHYELKHADSMDDDIILDLVKLLDGKFYEPEIVKGPFQYFAADRLELQGTTYRLVWLLENEKLYVGVVNAFRR